MSKTDDLDSVLSKPLAEIHDGGFSDRVTLQLIEMRARRERLAMAAVAAAAALVCLAMPFTEIGQAINVWMLDLAQQMSTPLAVVAGVLVISALIVRLYSDWIGEGPPSRSRAS